MTRDEAYLEKVAGSAPAYGSHAAHMDIVDRLRFDATRCAMFSKGVATNIEAAADEIERLRAALVEAAAPLNAKIPPPEATE